MGGYLALWLFENWRVDASCEDFIHSCISAGLMENSL